MVVMILERVPVSLRGELTRWLIEPKTGVFIGTPSGMVRDRLWDMAVRGAKGGSVMLLYSAQSEQGFLVRMYGDTSRDVRDWEGLLLPYIPRKEAGEVKARKKAGKVREEEEPKEIGKEQPCSAGGF